MIRPPRKKRRGSHRGEGQVVRMGYGGGGGRRRGGGGGERVLKPILDMVFFLDHEDIQNSVRPTGWILFDA